MAINNLNPRRTIWFSPNEPSNKYDIWLSRNAHLDENGEPTTDSNVQRDCDYIFKIYECGKWNPIVGFNSTARYKIDTVTGVDYTIDGVTHSGKNVYHPAIFTAESPNELYDAGSLGELLKDTHFVTEEDWKDIYNEYIKTIIEQYPFDLWPAESNRLGGIWADRFASTHSDTFVVNKTWLAQCKYKYNASNNYNLYVHAKDLIDAINTYTTDNPGSGNNINIPVATYELIGGINADIDTTHSDYRGLPVLRGGPNCGLTYGDDVPLGTILHGESLTYNPDNTFLYIPGWALQSWLNDPTGNGSVVPYNPTQIAILLENMLKNTASIGWRVLTTSLNPLISPEIWGVDSGNVGKFLRINPEWNSEGEGWSQQNNNIDWVDPMLNDLNDVTVSSPSNGDLLLYNSTTQKWENGEVPGIQGYPTMTSSNHVNGTPYVINGGGTFGEYLDYNGEWSVPVGTMYTPGDGIDITYGEAPGTSGVISQNIGTVLQETDEDVKSISEVTIEDSYSGDIIITEIDADNISDIVTRVGLCNYCEITPKTSTTNLTITLSHPNNLPVYILYNNNALSSVSINGAFDYIGNTSLSASSKYLFTIQFGIVKIEQVSTHIASVEEVS